MQEDAKAFSADDLNLIADPNDGGEDGGDKADPGSGGGDKTAETDEAGKGGKPPGDKAADSDAKPKGKSGTIATGRDSEREAAGDDAEAKPYWPDDWREKMARHRAGDDEKAYKKELRRLQNFASPEGVYGMGREAEAKLTSGQLLKVPGKEASEEEIEAFAKALGVPEKPDEYTKDLTLENGAVVGDADKPFVDSFAETMHKAKARPEEFKAALNWYYAQQEAQAAQMDEEDDAYRIDSERELKEEFGPAFKRRIGAMPVLFQQAPGGSDIKNERGVYHRLMGGRTSDGRLIGNDPDIIRWLDSMRAEINPSATVTEDGVGTPETVENEITNIEKIMREDRKTYNRDYADRYSELLNIREKNLARAR